MLAGACTIRSMRHLHGREGHPCQRSTNSASASPPPVPRRGRYDPMPRVTLMRADAPTPTGGTIYEPVACFAAQGSKRLILGERIYAYDPSHYLVVAVGLPVIAAVTEASPERPYLALALRLDPALIATPPDRDARDCGAAFRRHRHRIDRPRPARPGGSSRPARRPARRRRGAGAARRARSPLPAPLRDRRARCCDRSRSPTAGWRRSRARSPGFARTITGRSGSRRWRNWRR